MTPLETAIRARIQAQGPVTVAAYMAMCLADPQHGYYVTRDPFGARGDFVTAPEVSQMFGELLGLWTASVWKAMGSPTSNPTSTTAGCWSRWCAYSPRTSSTWG